MSPCAGGRRLPLASSVIVGFVWLLALCLPSQARAEVISLGALSFDQLIPPVPGDPTSIGTNAFNVVNSTGDYAFFASLPLNAVDPVSLLDAKLQLTPADGSAAVDVTLGTIAPGFLLDVFGNPLFELQFPDTQSFASAVFTATLGTSQFLLSDGSLFEAASPDLLFTLTPSGGVSLVPNPLSDFTGVDFLISGRIVPATPGDPPGVVPEPASVLLLGSGIAIAALRRRRGSVGAGL